MSKLSREAMVDETFSFVTITAILLGIFGVFFGGLWLLWTTVLPALWPTGPKAFTDPGFWVFCGGWLLFLIVLGVVRGAKK